MDNSQFDFAGNYYNLNEEKLNKIEIIFNKYFNKLQTMLDSEANPKDSVIFAMIIGEAFDLLKDKDKWNEVAYKAMSSIRKGIQTQSLPQTLSLFGGYCGTGLATYILSESTGHYKKFLSTINEMIRTIVVESISYCEANIENLKTQHYDCVMGLSGIASYLLIFKDDENISNSLELILKYLVKLTQYKCVEENIVPGWYVKSENQYGEEDKIFFPKGNFNFGLAHGIAGPLVILAKAYSEGKVVEGQRQAIEIIIKEYRKYTTIDLKGNSYWPTQLKFEDYVTEEAEDKIRPKKASWCYGNIGIVRALLLAGRAIEDEDTIGFAMKAMEGIAEMDIKDYILESPILCHGYAGLLSILNVMYKETKSTKIRSGVEKVLEILLNYYNEESEFGFINVERLLIEGKEVIRKSESNDFIEGTPGIILSLLSVMKEKTYFEKHLLIK